MHSLDNIKTFWILKYFKMQAYELCVVFQFFSIFFFIQNQINFDLTGLTWSQISKNNTRQWNTKLEIFQLKGKFASKQRQNLWSK